jgi:hypothetical protein
LLTLLVPALLQTIIAPLLSGDFADALGTAIKQPTINGALFGTVVLALSAGALAVMLATAAVGRTLVARIVCAWALVSVVQTLGALGDKSTLLSGWYGSRYFLFGAMCFCILLAWGTKLVRPFHRNIATGLLVLIVLMGVVELLVSPWLPVLMKGPSYRQQIKACRASQAAVCEVLLWPGDGNWRLKIRWP